MWCLDHFSWVASNSFCCSQLKMLERIDLKTFLSPNKLELTGNYLQVVFSQHVADIKDGYQMLLCSRKLE